MILLWVSLLVVFLDRITKMAFKNDGRGQHSGF